MAEKYLRITMPDGSKWDVPCDVIARNRIESEAEEVDYQEGWVNGEKEIVVK